MDLKIYNHFFMFLTPKIVDLPCTNEYKQYEQKDVPNIICIQIINFSFR